MNTAADARSYEQRQADETTARLARQAEFRKTAETVAAKIGAIMLPYNAPENEYLRQFDGQARMMKDGATFVLSMDMHDTRNAKINVFGTYPTYTDASGSRRGVQPRDVATYEERQTGSVAPEINVSATKGADKIAKDIARRFLPDFAKWHGRCVEHVKQMNTTANTVKQRAEEFASAYGSHGSKSIRAGDTSAVVYTKHATLQVSTSGVRFEAFYATDEQARQILAILKQGATD